MHYRFTQLMQRMMPLLLLLGLGGLSAQSNLVISEIMYNPPESGSDSLEFIEIYNAESVAIDLTGYTFVQGVTFTFPSFTLNPGETYLIAIDSAAAEGVYGVPFNAEWQAGALSNGGEDLIIVNTTNDTVAFVDYDDNSPWPETPDGDGPSLDLLDVSGDNNDPLNWVASCVELTGQIINGQQVFASPGTVEPCKVATIRLLTSVVTVSEGVGSVDIEVDLLDESVDSPRVKLVVTTFGTAENGVDYMVDDTVEFVFAADSANQTQTVTVNIMEDSDIEMDEYLSVRLIDAENADLGDATQVIYIKDNDRLAATDSNAISLNLLTSFENVPGADNAAEIVAYSTAGKRMVISNSENNSVDLVDLTDPANPMPITSVSISALGDINSVAVYDTLIAVAVANSNAQMPGLVVFMDTAGNILNQLTVGALPDMVTFTPDGSKVLTANEGEPSDDYTSDPEGSVSIISISGPIVGLTQTDVTTADFTAFNSQQATLETNGVRISAPGATVAEDLEPEFITVSADGNTAWVTCQENNAVAVVDLTGDSISAVLGLGSIDHSMFSSGLDATNNFDSINIANYPLHGLFMPDAIASYEVGGMTYLITANEGDSREYDNVVDETRLSGVDLDSASFPNGDILKSAIGRIKTINTEGDTDGDGDIDEIFTFGTRSFTIWDAATGALIYDSGDDFELITSQDPVIGAIFNTTDDELDFKDRSDDKGPEPEGVTTGVIGGRTYAFILLERVGGVMVYDVTDPTAPVFVQYINNRSTTDDSIGDLAPEGVAFISSSESPSGKPLLLVANEVSSTVGVYEISEAITGVVSFAETQQTVAEDLDSLSVALVLTDGNMDSTITVDVELGSFLTAEEGNDFVAAAATTVTFGPGETSAMVKFDLIDDADLENDEYFSFRLGNVNNAFLGEDSAHVAFIVDNDRVAPAASQAINLKLVTSYQNGVAGDDAVEIADYDPATERVFMANSEANEVNILDFSDPANPASFLDIDIAPYGGINSVAVNDTLVAVAVEDDSTQLPGSVVFFNTDGDFLIQIMVGALPDMVTFTPDGSKVLTANEGEPDDDYLVDPEGSISIIDISGGVTNLTQANVTTADFVAFNAQETQLKNDGVRIFGPGANVAQDLEPEYIAVSADGSTAYVTLQENNALAIVDINAGTVSSVLPLGFKDHSLEGSGLDAENTSDEVRIANYPVLGMYQPDAITIYSVGGTEYLVTANEGDARDYGGFSEEARIRDEEIELDPTAFPDGDLLKATIGRLKTTTTLGDTDGDEDFDEIYAYGARSFSIWNAATGALVYDSGDDFELITSQDSVYGAIFNTTDDELDFKDRSDDKGPEPEAVVVGEIEGEQYAFIALERIGGVMVYQVTDPTAPTFVQYVNNRSTTNDTEGDLAPEDIVLVPTNESPDGKYYVLVAHEVSSTLAVYEVEGVINSIDENASDLALRMYPNPSAYEVSIEVRGQEVRELQASIYTLDGREVLQAERQAGFGALTVNVSDLPAGIYLVQVNTELGQAQQRLIVR